MCPLHGSPPRREESLSRSPSSSGTSMQVIGCTTGLEPAITGATFRRLTTLPSYTSRDAQNRTVSEWSQTTRAASTPHPEDPAPVR